MQTTGFDHTRASDEDLARRFQADPAGETGRDAAAELFERYRERVYLWCARRVRDHETALDLAQDVLLSAYRALPTYEGRCPYGSWVFTITRNRCFRAMRPRGLVLDEDVDAGELPDREKRPDVLLEEKEAQEKFLRLIRRTLAPEEQLAIWLRCVEDLPVDEITRRLAIPGTSGARGVLQNARRKLRSALETDRHRERKELR